MKKFFLIISVALLTLTAQGVWAQGVLTSSRPIAPATGLSYLSGL